MFDFLLLQWKMGKIDEKYLDVMVSKGRITAEQGAEIKATPR